MSRGGKRQGAGRPRTSKKTTISVAIDRQLVEEIEAALDNQSRSEFVQTAVEQYLKKRIVLD
jgi:metal-responsive CopG/Arc/MetJ family transcriptional regulator